MKTLTKYFENFIDFISIKLYGKKGSGFLKR